MQSTLRIPLMKATFYREEETKRRLLEFISNASILSMNSECERFERLFALYQKRKFAVMVNSGSSANLLLIQALLNMGVFKKGDKVGVSALTWATNVMPLIQLGLEPVCVDVELGSFNVSVRTLQDKMEGLRALFITNALGFADDLHAIRALCSRNNIIVFEDNCESLGSSVMGEKLGNFGLASTFSFFVGHHLSTIEGGMICTDDSSLYEHMLMARSHGWDRQLSDSAKNTKREEWKVGNFFAKYTFYELGFNVRPMEIQGYLGSIQLPFLDEMIAARQSNFRRFAAALSLSDDFVPLEMDHMDVISNFAMPVLTKTRAYFDYYVRKFREAGIEIRPVISGDITRQPFYKKAFGEIVELPNARFIHEQGFYFANRPDLTEEEVMFLCGMLRK